jgi:hypothetical protein
MIRPAAKQADEMIRSSSSASIASDPSKSAASEKGRAGGGHYTKLQGESAAAPAWPNVVNETFPRAAASAPSDAAKKKTAADTHDVCWEGSVHQRRQLGFRCCAAWHSKPRLQMAS